MGASIMVADATLKEIESTRTVNQDQIWTLRFIFGKNLEGASRIVDQRGVKRITAEPSGRVIFQVTGESRRKDKYVCFPENFCACYSFFFDVVNRAEQLCCKHQIATKLAVSLGVCVEAKVSDEELALLLSKI
ncbi:putative Zinc finger, SWIM-type [Lupinus albus]|uniref:Putative Zinc finger, SWIM-type n=1 Tax=Lupinus albus TaxID=3870 RepID=A0A6A4NT89_LUPAL|nr:putative Zinc finger, SWIM-type [Lupinus albus]